MWSLHDILLLTAPSSYFPDTQELINERKRKRD